jgi:stage II sporulation protein AA (anti-sigma F factor antagonist)
MSSSVISAERDVRKARLVLGGDLDMSARFQAEQALDALLSEPVEQLVVDLGEVTFVDSTGMGLVLEVHDRARTEGFRLRLLRGPAEVQRVFELAGVADLLPFV